jgi:ATP-binding protein involved in chromosome partitioning
MMLGARGRPGMFENRIIPVEAHGIKMMSIGLLVQEREALVWRGPMIHSFIQQMLNDVSWGALDYLVFDMPPGTGDAQLSLVQATNVDGAIIVTTPQEVSVGDALRGAKMFQRVDVPVLGIVENMSYFESPDTGKPLAIFGSGGGQRLADELEVPLLGHVPLYPPVLEGGDTGRPIVVAEPDAPVSRALRSIADRVAATMESMASPR